MEMILHAPTDMPQSPLPCGRTIKPETEQIADKHRGILFPAVATVLCLSSFGL